MNQYDQLQNAETIQAVQFVDVRQFLEAQAQEFEMAEMEYKEGKKDAFTLYAKIASIMGELDRIPKSGYNQQFNYHYVTESDVVGAVRPLMAKYKLVMIPSIRRYKVEEFQAKYSKMFIGTIEIKWTIIDGESAEQVSFSMIGKGVDNLEKDIYKAVTGNKKYALITLFMIDSGDDPERNDTPTDTVPNGQNQAQDRSNDQKGTNTPKKGNKGNTGQSGTNQTPPQQEQVKQPLKSDLLTRWMVLDTSEKPVKDKRADFDDWYKKKQDAGWDHLAMIQALTKRIQEKNEKQKQAEKNQSQNEGEPPVAEPQS